MRQSTVALQNISNRKKRTEWDLEAGSAVV